MRHEGTVFQTLEHWAQDRPDRPMITVGTTTRTYGEAYDEARRVAAALVERGVTKGSRVAIMAPTSVPAVVSGFAIAATGAIGVPLNIFLKGDPLLHQLTDSGCTALITDLAGVEMVRPLLSQLPMLRAIVVVDSADAVRQIDLDVENLNSFEELVEATEPLEPEVLTFADPYLILYTSGTTGMPKGCVVSHGQAVAWERYTERLCGIRDDDVIFTAAPLFHVGGMNPLLGGIACGLHVVMESGFSASNYIARAKAVGATIAVGVGWIAQALLKQPETPADRDHSLRAFSTVQISTHDQQAIRERFGIQTLTQQYGMTECYPITYNAHADQGISPYAGAPAPEIEVQIHDDAGFEVPKGEVGEIVVRPREPYVMFDGYWQNPEATVKAFKGLWFHTGDLGRFVEGQIQFVDRKKDSMRRRGENVSAFEVERTIMQFPNIAQVAVHGVRIDSDTDDTIKACIVVKPGEELSLPELAAFMNTRLPYFAVPQLVELYDALPTNAAGRVMKDVLRRAGVTDKTQDLVAMGLGVEKHERRLAADRG